MFNQFLLGGIVVACFAVGLFFLRFWRKSHERLFAIFAVAFWLLGINWLALSFTRGKDEIQTALYIVRLAGFILILIGIIDKNRPRGAGDRPAPPA